ncbi:transporter substrate-binding domain-containing protein [Allopusillimonas soli]|uniref:ABC transporter substrate-binding protein n=1 Tax=Allopusillimonas soli TaxID=659016 RepID=A0A853FCT9_9BURK|nr:ABC transporter substrate-binding protein [Allopusillimonas soli]NYT37472.1 ABC transporter substrate-binding protein [Allopusillimonas soli]TEA74548.1 transporter substrate-binding domain-containing protein [Allopusillimonas soli]
MQYPFRSSTTFVALALMMLSAGSAAASQLDEAKARGTIICGTQNASSPYGYQDPDTRQYVGYDVDMCKAIAKEMGLKMEHKPVSTEARIPEVKMGRVDMMAGSVAWLPKRAEQVDFSKQYLQGYIKVLVKKDSGISKLSDLKDKKVCASSGSSSAAIAQKVLKDARVLTFQNISQCYVGLQSGKVSAMTAGELVLRRFLNDSVKEGKPTALLSEPTYTEHIGIIVKKGESELLAAINQAIVSLDESGELTKIYDKWMGDESIYKMTRDFKVESVAAAAKADMSK